MTTYASFATQVRRHLEESTSTVWADESLLWWTNETCIDIARRTRPETDEQYIDTTAGSSDYTLPDLTLDIMGARYNNRYLAPYDATAIGDDTEYAGEPSMFALVGRVVRLYPTPSEAGELRIKRHYIPDSLTDADDLPFSGLANTVIEYGVLARVFEQINDWQSAESYRARYEEALATFSMNASAQEAGTPSYPVETY